MNKNPSNSLIIYQILKQDKNNKSISSQTDSNTYKKLKNLEKVNKKEYFSIIPNLVQAQQIESKLIIKHRQNKLKRIKALKQTFYQNCRIYASIKNQKSQYQVNKKQSVCKLSKRNKLQKIQNISQLRLKLSSKKRSLDQRQKCFKQQIQVTKNRNLSYENLTQRQSISKLQQFNNKSQSIKSMIRKYSIHKSINKNKENSIQKCKVLENNNKNHYQINNLNVKSKITLKYKKKHKKFFINSLRN